ncbi:Nn.00g055540.m01.CDS01 [Neocucurbitaria sp. VM-36]
MDIGRWLDETVQPEHLPSLPQTSAVATFYPKRPDPALGGRHRRERSKSDSSLLDPLLREKTPKRKRNPPTEASTDDNANSEASHLTRSEPTGSNSSSQKYARRPRRKTHPERYEPSSKAVQERGKHAYRSRKGESKKSLRKSKRKKCEKPCSGIVQCFHAKNVSGDRLTLKPREQLGLFNKGKTSMAVKGRGLPDLVFSEMKFLQQQKDQPEPIPQAEPPKKKRKNDYAHTKEGEISAFFTSLRPALAERDGNIQGKESCQAHDTLLEPTRRERGRKRSSAVEAAIPMVPTIELPDRASHLDFESRGPRHENTSVVSWSESTQAPSMESALPRDKHAHCTSQSNMVNLGGNGSPRDKRDTSFKRPAALSLGQPMTHSPAEHFEVSPVALSLRRISRSQSCPRHTSSPRRVNLVDRAAKFRSTDTIGSPSSMPPIAPLRANVDTQQVQVTDGYEASKVRLASLSDTNTSSSYRQPTLYSEETAAGLDSHFSDLGRVLQQCNSTFHQRHRVATRHGKHTVPEVQPQFAPKVERQDSIKLHSATHRVPMVRFAGVENRAPPLPSLTGPRLYEQQAQRQQLSLQVLAEEKLLADMGIIEEYFDGTKGVGHGNQSWERSPERSACYRLEDDSGISGNDESFVTEDVSTARAVSRLKSPVPLPAPVVCRQSALTFVTVAPQHRSSPPASPTTRSSDNSNIRIRQLAGHLLHTTATPSSPATHAGTEKSTHNMSYTTRKIGSANTLEHRIFIEKDGQLVSPWHDIPLYANEQQTVLNMVVEVPRWTNAKMEISKEETLNPIKQDIKKGKLRYVRNCFPHKGYLWNYGAFPQTWEDPNVVHQETKAKGDNDPLDVCEIGELVSKPGEVIQVKVLGVMALLDEGETDWKIIVINVNDPLAPKLNDVEDVERHLPGLLRATNEWFRIYKIPDGKPENQFAFSGECKNKKYAMDIVRECAEAWEKLATGKTPKDEISLTNTTVSHSPDRTDANQLNIPPGENKGPAPIDPSIDKWFYISGAPSN